MAQMNLSQAQKLLSGLPLDPHSFQLLQSYANGASEEIPPVAALMALKDLETRQKTQGLAQGAAKGPMPSVKDQVVKSTGLMALQKQRQDEAQKQMAQGQMQAPGPAPEGVPQPQAQPQAPMGGIDKLPVPQDMFAAAEGGVVGYDGGGKVGKAVELSDDQQYWPKDEEYNQTPKGDLSGALYSLVHRLTHLGAAPPTPPAAPPQAPARPVPQAAPGTMGSGADAADALPPSMSQQLAPPPAPPQPRPQGAPGAGQGMAGIQGLLKQVNQDPANAMIQKQLLAAMQQQAPTAGQSVQDEKTIAAGFGLDKPYGDDIRKRAAAMDAQYQQAIQGRALDNLIAGMAGATRGRTGLVDASLQNKGAQAAADMKHAMAMNQLLSDVDKQNRTEAGSMAGRASGLFGEAGKNYTSRQNNALTAGVQMRDMDMRMAGELLRAQVTREQTAALKQQGLDNQRIATMERAIANDDVINSLKDYLKTQAAMPTNMTADGAAKFQAIMDGVHQKMRARANEITQQFIGSSTIPGLPSLQNQSGGPGGFRVLGSRPSQ